MAPNVQIIWEVPHKKNYILCVRALDLYDEFLGGKLYKLISIVMNNKYEGLCISIGIVKYCENNSLHRNRVQMQEWLKPYCK